MASNRKELEDIDKLIDTMSPNAMKQMVRAVVGFSCVPYKPHDHWCNNCASCWLKYLTWLRDKENESL